MDHARPQDASLHNSNFNLCNAWGFTSWRVSQAFASRAFTLKPSPGLSAQIDHALPQRAAQVIDMRRGGLEANASLARLLGIDLAVKRLPIARGVERRARRLAEQQCEIDRALVLQGLDRGVQRDRGMAAPPGVLAGHDPADAAGVQLAAVPGDLAAMEPNVADHVVGIVAHQDAQVGMREGDAGPRQCCDNMRRPDRVEQRLGLLPRCIPVQDVDLDAHSPYLFLPKSVFNTVGTFYKGFPLSHVSHSSGHQPMTFTLPPLPYAYDALGAYMSKETLEFHHDKHHQAYVTNGNNAIKGTEFEGKSLEEIVKGSFGKNPAVFNNAGQHYNHLHFWSWMKPNGGGTKLPGRLEKKITEDLGGLEKFKTDFAAAGVGQFGSGWCWLQVKNGKLEISKTANGENPLVHGATPILGCDVWEHSYYIDYRNRRPDYLKAFVDHLVNWEYVDQLFSKA